MNPFQALPAGEREFVGRAEELHTIENRLDELANGVSLAIAFPGLSGYGKSSLLRRTQELIGLRSILTVHDPRPVGKGEVLSFSRVATSFIRAADQWCSDRQQPVLAWGLPPAAESALTAHWRDFLEDCMRRFKRETGIKAVLFCLDEAQLLDAEGLAAFKAVIQSQQGVGVVLSWRIYEDYAHSLSLAYRQAIADRAAQLDSDGGALRTFCETVLPATSFIDHDEASDCIRKRLDLVGGDIAPEVEAEIIAASRLKPGLVVSLSRNAYEAASKRREPTTVLKPEDFSTAVLSTFEESVRAAEAVIRAQTRDTLAVMKAAAARGDCVSVSDVTDQIQASLGRAEPDLDRYVRAELLQLAEVCAGVRFDAAADSVMVSDPGLYYVFRTILAGL